MFRKPTFQIRNSNIEMLNKCEYQMTKLQNIFRELENSSFDIVSDFVLRILSFDISIPTSRFGVVFTICFGNVVRA